MRQGSVRFGGQQAYSDLATSQLPPDCGFDVGREVPKAEFPGARHGIWERLDVGECPVPLLWERPRRAVLAAGRGPAFDVGVAAADPGNREDRAERHEPGLIFPPFPGHRGCGVTRWVWRPGGSGARIQRGSAFRGWNARLRFTSTPKPSRSSAVTRGDP